jgi:DNA repair protein RadD
VRVICNVATLSTGIDLPMTSCIIDARPTKSAIRFVQTIGRGLRTAPGKDHLLAHAGNHLRLGLVTDIHHAQLDIGEPRKPGERKERAAPLPRLCESCKAVLPHQVKVCPQCGVAIEAKSDVDAVDGELVELGSRLSGKHVPTISEKAQFYGELRSIAHDRGYSDGWISHKFKEMFGV